MRINRLHQIVDYIVAYQVTLRTEHLAEKALSVLFFPAHSDQKTFFRYDEILTNVVEIPV